MEFIKSSLDFLSNTSNSSSLVIGVVALSIGGYVWKIADDFFVDLILRFIKPDIIISRYIKSTEKRAKMFLSILTKFDNNILDKNKKKMPEAIKKIEKELVVGLTVTQNVMNNTINEAIKIIKS